MGWARDKANKKFVLQKKKKKKKKTHLDWVINLLRGARVRGDRSASGHHQRHDNFRVFPYIYVWLELQFLALILGILSWISSMLFITAVPTAYQNMRTIFCSYVVLFVGLSRTTRARFKSWVPAQECVWISHVTGCVCTGGPTRICVATYVAPRWKYPDGQSRRQ